MSFALELDVVTTLGGLSESLVVVESFASLHASGVLGCFWILTRRSLPLL
jgi:hypothetical protein